MLCDEFNFKLLLLTQLKFTLIANEKFKKIKDWENDLGFVYKM